MDVSLAGSGAGSWWPWEPISNMPAITEEVGIGKYINVLFILIKTGKYFNVVTAEQLLGCAGKTAFWWRTATIYSIWEQSGMYMQEAKLHSYRLVLWSSDIVLHILALFVWFVGSLLPCSRPLLLLLKMEHKFESRSLSELEVPAVTKEGRKSMLLVAM